MIPNTLKSEFKGKHFLLIPGHLSFFGGAERQSLILAKSLMNELECKVTVLGWGRGGDFSDALRDKGISTIGYEWDYNAKGYWKYINLLKLAKYIRQTLKPDYMLPFATYQCKIIGSIWRLCGAKFCWWNQRDEGRGIYGTRTEYRLMNSLPAIVSNSWEGRDFLMKKFNLNSKRIIVINNGVELPELEKNTAWRSNFGIEYNDIVFTMVANLTKFKDHKTALQAFSKLKESDIGKRCKFILAGRHHDKIEELKALSFDLGLCESLIMPGMITTNEISNLLLSTDVVVHSSVKEGCPNAVLEAMAHGLCVVGTDISGMRQALGETISKHYLAPAGDVNTLASLMHQVALSSDERQLLGKANRLTIKNNFNIEKMTLSVLETIHDTLGNIAPAIQTSKNVSFLKE